MDSKGRCLRDTGLFACPVGMLFSDFSGADQRPRRGRSAGPNFSPMRNWGKNRLGRSPLRTSLGYGAGPASSLGSARHPCCGSCYCHHTRPPWAAGPMAGWFPYPGLPWRSGVPAAGSQATDRWEQRLTRLRAAKRRTQGLPVPRGEFHKAGEGPAFGGLWFLSGGRKEPPAGSVPTRLASLNQGV